jgi:spore coat polysaccharide biosynthesis protein SpsF
MRAGIVLQARMGSTRLPGKAMARLGGEPIVACCLRRLASRSGLPVVLATTVRPEDNVLCETARGLGFPFVRGHVDDVLARYVLAATTFRFSYVVRATADNPVVDLDAPRRTLDLLCRTGAGYASESGLPLGAAVEAFTVRALKQANSTTIDPYDREHVTPFLRRGGRIAAVEAPAPAALRRGDLRLTVDTSDDLASVRHLFDFVGDRATLAPLVRFIGAADQLYGHRLAMGATAP